LEVIFIGISTILESFIVINNIVAMSITIILSSEAEITAPSRGLLRAEAGLSKVCYLANTIGSTEGCIGEIVEFGFGSSR